MLPRVVSQKLNSNLFLKNLSFSFVGGAVSSFVIFVASIVAARILGPEEYGKIGLFNALSQILVIPMLFGLDNGATKYLSKSEGDKQQKYFSGVLLLGLLFNVGFLVIYLLAHKAIAFVANTDSTFILTVLFFTFFLGIKFLLEGALKGFERFKAIAKYKITEAVFIVVFLCIFLFTNHAGTYLFYIASIFAAGLIVILLYSNNLRQSIFAGKFSGIKGEMVSLLRFGRYGIIYSLIYLIFTQGDKIVVSRFMGETGLGLYTAYCTGTLLISYQVSVILNSVFFPAVSKNDDKAGLLKKLDRMFTLVFLPSVLLFACFSLLVLKFMGSSYPINILTILCFALAAGLQMFSSMYSYLVMSHNTKVFGLSVLLYFGRLILLGIVLAIFIQEKKLTAEIIALGLAAIFTIEIITQRFLLKHYKAL